MFIIVWKGHCIILRSVCQITGSLVCAAQSASLVTKCTQMYYYWCRGTYSCCYQLYTFMIWWLTPCITCTLQLKCACKQYILWVRVTVTCMEMLLLYCWNSRRLSNLTIRSQKETIMSHFIMNHAKPIKLGNSITDLIKICTWNC